MELNRFDRQLAVAHAHDHAIVRLGGDFKATRKCFTAREQRVVAADLEPLRQTFEYAEVAVGDLGRLAVHGIVQDSQLAAESFNEKANHPGNVYWYQAVRANEVFKALDGKQRKLALLDTDPRKEQATKTVALSGNIFSGEMRITVDNTGCGTTSTPCEYTGTITATWCPSAWVVFHRRPGARLSIRLTRRASASARRRVITLTAFLRIMWFIRQGITAQLRFAASWR